MQSVGWRWYDSAMRSILDWLTIARIFLIQVLICIFAVVMISIFLDLPKRESKISTREQLSRIDFLGAILLISVVFGLLFGLDRGTNASWRSPWALVPLCLTLPALAAFLWVETRFAVEPFAPGHVIFARGLVPCYANNLFLYGGFTALIFYIPFYLQVVLAMSPAEAGAGLIPAALSAVIGTLTGGLILKKIGRFYWLAVTASLVATVTSVLIPVAPSLDRTGSLIALWVASVVSFIPQGMVVTASLIAIRELITSPRLYFKS